MKLRVAETTKRFIDRYAVDQPHAVLLTGSQGVGLHTFALHLAKRNGAVLREVCPETKQGSTTLMISARQIRQLYEATRVKQSSAHFIIIDDAEYMNHVAQNALLKLLEEPNDSTRFIMTSHKPDALLPTIRSRLQTYVVQPITSIESKRLLDSHDITDESTRERLLFVADGLPAELSRLASDKGRFSELFERVQMARQFVEGSAYQRCVLIHTLKDDRADIIRLIDMVIMLLRRSLKSRPDTTTIKLIDKLISAAEAIRANGNIKLQLTAAVL